MLKELISEDMAVVLQTVQFLRELLMKKRHERAALTNVFFLPRICF